MTRNKLKESRSKS